MALTPEQIAGAVSYFTQKNTARLSGVQQVSRQIAQPTFQYGGGFASLAGGSRVPNAITNTIKGIPIVGSLLTIGGKNSMLEQAFEEMGEDETPRNATQWILNMLASGLYGAAEGTEDAVSNAMDVYRREQAGEDVNLIDKTRLGGAVDFIRGFGKGLTEGFGARYDEDGDGANEAPLTQSKNLENVGALDAVRSGVRNLGGDEGWQNAAAFTLGLGADILSDPLTFVGGTGLVRGGRAAIAGASDALRAGEGVLPALGAGARAGAAERSAVFAERAAQRAARNGQTAGRTTLAEQLATEEAARLAARQADAPRAASPDAPNVTGGETFAAAAAGPVDLDAIWKALGVDRAAMRDLTSAPLRAGTPSDLARADEIQRLLPALSSTPRNIDAAKVLDDAQSPGTPALSAPVASQAIDAMSNTRRAADFTSAIKGLRKSPEGMQFLRQTVTVNGRKMTVGKAMESAAFRRMSSSEDKVAFYSGEPYRLAVTEALRAATRIPMRTTPESLAASIRANIPGYTGGVDVPTLMRYLGTASRPERETILRRTFNLPREQFPDFEAAMLAAADGRVEASMMRSMLSALGVSTTATKPQTLQRLLMTKGRLNWDEIQRSMPTQREVFDNHGVTPVTENAARQVDVEDLRDAAHGDYEQILDDAVGFNPTIVDPIPTPTGAGTVGVMIRDGIAALDTHVNPKTGLLNEADDSKAWLAVHRAVWKALGRAANPRRGGSTKGLAGAARGDFVYERWLTAMKAVTAYAASKGMFPRLSFGSERPFYVSIDQIAEHLPVDVIKGALFNLNYRLSKFGKGAQAAEKFRAGLSIYPTTIGNGARTAARGGSREEILAAMRADDARNAFQRAEAGQQSLVALAKAMDDDEFRAAMVTLHEAQEIATVAMTLKTVDRILNPLASRIVAAVARSTDRSIVLNEIRRAVDEVRDLAPLADGTLVRELAQQHLDNGTLAILGEHGAVAMRADARAAANAQLNGVAMRVASAKAGRQMLDDADELSAKLESEMLEQGWYEPTQVGHMLAMSEIEQGLGPATLFARIGGAFIGDWGMQHFKRIQVAVQSGSFAHSHEYVNNLTSWLRGGSKGGVLGAGGTKIEGLTTRLADELQLGRPATVQEVNAQINVWWHALAVHTGRGIEDPTALRAALIEGAHANPRLGIAQAAAPLSPAQADMALELRAWIDAVFAPTTGPMARVMASSDDMAAEMARYGFTETGPFSAYTINKAKPLAEQANIWREFENIESPLDLLANWHKSLSAASVKPGIGSSASRLFDHTASGLTREEALAQGWKHVPKSSTGIAKYLDPDSLFPPFVFRELPYLDRFFRDIEKGLPEMLKRIAGPYDAATGALKSSQTIWNPAHHVTNVLGEFAMLIMAGVNPLHALRSIHAIKAGGKMVEADTSAIGAYLATHTEAAAGGKVGTIKPKFASGQATIRVQDKDGKITEVVLSPEEVWTHALNSGAAITARHSKDVVGGPVRESVEGTRWDRFTTSKLNVVARLDHRLGEFSAARDNITRLGHYYAALEGKTFRSVDEALHHAASEVHSYHPTIQTLSATEQTYMRRIIFFYTWIRQAAARVLLTALERPALVTLPSKVQYNQALANGLDPESIGKPIPDDPRIPSYLSDGVLGPTFMGGYSPFGGLNELEAGEEPHLWGLSLSTPQLDALHGFLKGTTFDGTMTGAARGTLENSAGMLNPFFKIPFELATHERIGGIGAPIETDEDVADYLFSQTGVPYRLAGALGLNQNDKFTDAESAGDQQRKLWNWLSGLKFTDYTNATNARVAQQETSDRQLQALREAGYTDEQIRWIREAWKIQNQ